MLALLLSIITHNTTPSLKPLHAWGHWVRFITSLLYLSLHLVFCHSDPSSLHTILSSLTLVHLSQFTIKFAFQYYVVSYRLLPLCAFFFVMRMHNEGEKIIKIKPKIATHFSENKEEVNELLVSITLIPPLLLLPVRLDPWTKTTSCLTFKGTEEPSGFLM